MIFIERPQVLRTRPRLYTLALILALAGCVSALPVLERVQPYTVVIENVTVIDAQAGQRGPLTVMIRGDTIAKVSSTELRNTWPAEVQVIDGTNKFLIPGLWDMHVHLAFIPGFGPEMLSLFIANGITSVRDTGGPLDAVLAMRREARSRGADAPRVFVAGPLLDGAPVVYDGSAASFPAIGKAVVDAKAGRAQVASLARAGVDLIKAYEMLPPETYRAILTEARRHKLPVTGHIPLSMSATDALDAGLASVEHLRNIDLACAAGHAEMLVERQHMLAAGKDTPGRTLRSRIHSAQRDRAIADYDATVCERVIDSIVANKTAQIPTFALVNAFYRAFYVRPQWQQTFSDLPIDLRERWRADAERFAGRIDQSLSARNRREAYVSWFTTTIESIHTKGGTILAGTDTPIFFMTPGASLHKELEVLVAAGLEPIDALAAATTGPAHYFNREKSLGHVSAGATADLVLLDANPLVDIRHTRKISAVIRNGQVRDRDMLDGLLEQVRATTY